MLPYCNQALLLCYIFLFTLPIYVYLQVTRQVVAASYVSKISEMLHKLVSMALVTISNKGVNETGCVHAVRLLALSCIFSPVLQCCALLCSL